MTIPESVGYCLTNYFRGAGRGGRSEFWLFITAYLFACVVAWEADEQLGFDIFATAVSLGAAIPLCSATTRRLHDTGRSGWWQALWILPLLNLLLVYWLSNPGTPGSNRFGPPPGERPER